MSEAGSCEGKDDHASDRDGREVSVYMFTRTIMMMKGTYLCGVADTALGIILCTCCGGEENAGDVYRVHAY